MPDSPNPSALDPIASITDSGAAMLQGLADINALLAARAGLTPEQAQGMPDAVLRSLALQPSYAEGENAPGPWPGKMAPALEGRDPSSTKAINDWLAWMWQNQANYQAHGQNLARGGRVKRRPVQRLSPLQQAAVIQARRRMALAHLMRMGALNAAARRR